jgi:glutathione peroxidase
MRLLVTIAFLIIVAALFGFRKYRMSIRAELISAAPTNFYDLKYADIHGREVSMSEYKGKYVLCVNVASKCGNTPQYKELQQLYEKHRDKLVVIGFPCNQFLGQEPGSAKDIEEFCTKEYGVTFPLASKLDVKGSSQHPVYTWLTSKELNGVSNATVEWNFHKFLVSPDGKWLQSFSAKSNPMHVEVSLK